MNEKNTRAELENRISNLKRMAVKYRRHKNEAAARRCEVRIQEVREDLRELEEE